MVNEEIIKKYIKGDCTPKEKERVEVWLQSTTVPNETDYAKEFAASRDRIWNEIREDIPQKQNKVIPLYKTLTRYAAAACLAVGLFAGGYFILEQEQRQLDYRIQVNCDNQQYKNEQNSFEAKRVKIKGGSECIAIYFKGRTEEYVVYHPDRLPNHLPDPIYHAIQELMNKAT